MDQGDTGPCGDDAADDGVAEVPDGVDPTDRVAELNLRALALEAAGLDAAAMADELGVPVESIPVLLRIAHRKARGAGGENPR
jgi:hypothetical protein